MIMKNKVVSALTTAALVSAAYAGSASADTYTVQKGDSLYLIAKKYHTSVPDLKTINGLPSDLIRINQVLQVSIPTVQQAPVAKAPAPAAVYTVASGDTLSKIARQFGVSLADLKQWNGINGYLIFPGQQLKVSDGNSAAPVAATPAPVVSAPAAVPVVQPAPAAAQPAPAQSAAEYVVASGDTLSKIAKQFGVSLSDLKQWNSINSYLIFPGQKLKVSNGGPAVAAPVSQPAPAPAAPVSQPAPTPAPVAPAPAASKTIQYTVSSGDTLGKIAMLYDMSVSDLMKLNNLASSLIFVGQTLKVVDDSASDAPAVSAPQASVSAISFAKGLMGIPYVWGGSTLSGFDCSGFIYYVFNKTGKSIGRYSAAGYYDRSYYVDQPQPGDLVFFANTYTKGISHLGIYLGDRQFIHADETYGVKISSLDSTYYKAHFDSFKRLY